MKKKALNFYPKLTNKQIVNKIKFLLRNLKEDLKHDLMRSGSGIVYHIDLCASYQHLIDWVVSKNRDDLDSALWYLIGK